MHKRFPDTQSILAVYAVIAFITYTWTLIAFSNKIPAWIYYLSPSEIGVIFVYAMTVDFLESLVWLALLFLAAFLLPVRLLRDEFLVRAGWFSLVFLTLLLLYLIPDLNLYGKGQLPSAPWLVISFVSAVLAAWLSSRFRWMGRFMHFISDRLLVMLVIYLPISLLSLTIVIVRLILGKLA